MIVKPDVTIPAAHRACRTAGGERKVPYPSKAAAKRAARIVESHRAGGRPLAVYRCWVCARWHVGHNNEKSK